MGNELDEQLQVGRDLLKRGAWAEARAAFERMLGPEAPPEALEGLGWACWWLGDADALFEARERAYREYRKSGDVRSAARLALWIGADYVEFRGQLAISNGWKQRARRLLQGPDLTPEHGWLLLLDGAVAIEVNHDTVAARRLGVEAAEIGRRLAVIDLEVIGLAMQGLAVVSEGDGESGLGLLDEAMAAAAGGELEHPFSIGWVACYLINACERIRDLDRAAQWCRKVEELAHRWQFQFFFGICRAHYAGVLIWRGKWAEAEAELVTSTRDLRESRPPYEAEGVVRMAELRRRQGRTGEAAELFAQADGHPLALLGAADAKLDQGLAGEAEEILLRYLRQIPEENRSLGAPAFELLVRTYAALGDVERAKGFADRLRSVAAALSTDPLLAAFRFADATVAMAAGDPEAAISGFQTAVDLYERGGAPLEAGRSRIELAKALVALGNRGAARREAGAALAAFSRIGADGEAARASALMAEIDEAGRGRPVPVPTSSSPLTPREVEVLRLVALGRSDKEIAARLIISEHTVHRHISNIRTKLDAPSRAAAAVVASRQNFI